MTVVRRGEVTDAEGIAAVHVGVWQAAYRGVVPDAFLDGLSVERRADWWRRVTAGEEPGTVRVADDAGRIIGFACTGPAHDDDLPEGSGELYTIYVLPERWGSGVAKRLLAAAHGDLAASGAPEAMLWVLRDNPRARRFYEREGWALDGSERSEDLSGVAVAEVRYRLALQLSTAQEAGHGRA